MGRSWKVICDSVRVCLGITENFIFSYIGQIIHRKGVDVLLRTFENNMLLIHLYLVERIDKLIPILTEC